METLKQVLDLSWATRAIVGLLLSKIITPKEVRSSNLIVRTKLVWGP